MPSRTIVRTDDISAEESIDPAHDQSIRDDHCHIVLHHPHHSIHGARIGQRVCWRLTLLIWRCKKLAGVEACNQILTAGVEGLLRQNMVVVAESDTVAQGALLTSRPRIELLGGVCE